MVRRRQPRRSEPEDYSHALYVPERPRCFVPEKPDHGLEFRHWHRGHSHTVLALVVSVLDPFVQVFFWVRRRPWITWGYSVHDDESHRASSFRVV